MSTADQRSMARAQADAQAAIAAARSLRDEQAESLQFAYSAARLANGEAISKAGNADLSQRYNAVASACAAVEARAARLPAVLGPAQLSLTYQQTLGGYATPPDSGAVIATRMPVKADAYMVEMLRAADEIRAQLNDASAQAQAVVDSALATVAPDMPQHVDGTAVGFLRADLAALLESTPTTQRQGVANGLVRDSVDRGDFVTAALLLGTGALSLELVLRRMPGVDQNALRRQYVVARVAASPSGVNGQGVYGGMVPPAAAFIQLQDDSQRSMAAMAAYCGQYYDRMRSLVASYITQ